jgi:hypothetical protein
MGLLRLRAEVLLKYDDEERIPKLTPQEREELERITAAPKDEDRDYLGSFDRHIEEMIKNEGDE